MEKYTIFDDLKNGRNPFRPIRGKKRNVFQKATCLTALIFLLPLRLFVGAIALIILKASSFVPIKGLRRLFQWISLRILLLCLGFWTVGGRLANMRKLHSIGTRRRQRGKLEADFSFAGGISKGHVVISNYCSALELLLLAFWLPSPQFAFPLISPRDRASKEAEVVVLDLFSAIKQVYGSQETLQKLGKKARSLSTAVTQSNGPLVVFAEGSRTNGSCVMDFLLFDPVDATCNKHDAMNVSSDDKQMWGKKNPVHIIAISYKYTYHNPHGDPGALLFTSLWRLLTQVWNSVEGIHLHHHFIKETTAVRCDRSAFQEWLAAIQQGVGPVHAVDASRYAAFLALYNGGGSSDGKFALEGGGGAGEMPQKTKEEIQRERFF
jgi:1-acyl-sn-glycerol-3-phosphate acyltransferase